MSYSRYDRDNLKAADTMRIERTIYFEAKKADISTLTALTVEQLQALREESAVAEQAIFNALQEQAAAWEEQAGKTLLLDKAIEYARTPPPSIRRTNGNSRTNTAMSEATWFIKWITAYPKTPGTTRRRGNPFPTLTPCLGASTPTARTDIIKRKSRDRVKKSLQTRKR